MTLYLFIEKNSSSLCRKLLVSPGIPVSSNKEYLQGSLDLKNDKPSESFLSRPIQGFRPFTRGKKRIKLVYYVSKKRTKHHLNLINCIFLSHIFSEFITVKQLGVAFWMMSLSSSQNSSLLVVS